MVKRCTLCDHPDRPVADAMILSGRYTDAQVGASFELSDSSVWRHGSRCLNRGRRPKGFRGGCGTCRSPHFAAMKSELIDGATYLQVAERYGVSVNVLGRCGRDHMGIPRRRARRADDKWASTGAGQMPCQTCIHPLRAWLDEHLRTRSITQTEAGRIVGVTQTAIGHHVREHIQGPRERRCCSVCGDRRRQSVEAAILRGTPYPEIDKRFSLHEGASNQHAANHMGIRVGRNSRNRCTVCAHPDLEEIEDRVLAGERPYTLAREYGLWRGAVAGHMRPAHQARRARSQLELLSAAREVLA